MQIELSEQDIQVIYEALTHVPVTGEQGLRAVVAVLDKLKKG